jgi:hypothetical protein
MSGEANPADNKKPVKDIILTKRRDTLEISHRRAPDPEAAKRLIQGMRDKMKEDMLSAVDTLADYNEQIKRFDDMISGKTEPDAPMESMIKFRDYLIGERDKFLEHKSAYLNGSVLFGMFYTRIASWWELGSRADSMLISDFNDPKERANYLSFSPETFLADIEKALYNVENNYFWYRK